jgi:hypothetical protein
LKPIIGVIEEQLTEVNDVHVETFHATIRKPETLLQASSFIHDKMFPYVALHELANDNISSIQFGTLMALRGNLKYILPKFQILEKQNEPKYIPLFTSDAKPNPLAEKYLLETFQEPTTKLPFLLQRKPEEIIEHIFKEAIHLPSTEQGFWIIINNNPSYDTFSTITFQISYTLEIHFLRFFSDKKAEILSSMGLQQLFLNAAFTHPVQLNPVIGESSPEDLRHGNLARLRDIAVPFPDNELPKTADYLEAPTPLDFMFHDFYHAIRASRVSLEESKLYVEIGDYFARIQKSLHLIVKQFNEIHRKHSELLPVFAESIKKFPLSTQQELIVSLHKKFNQEISIINLLKKLRKSSGQLKFRIWDMERALSGGILDNLETSKFDLILGNLSMELSLFGKLPDTSFLLSFVGRRMGEIMLSIAKPDPITINEIYEEILKGREMRRFLQSQYFFIEETPRANIAFEDAILAAKR